MTQGLAVDTSDAFGKAGATLSGGRLVHFGNAAQEFAALTRAGLVPLLGTTPLRLTGSDRLEFLHGQVSHEVKRLSVGESRPALMLNVRGHALALMRVYRREDDLFVAVEGGAGAQVETQFRAHIIFDQVALTDLTGTITALTLQGSEAGSVLQDVFGAELPQEHFFSEYPFATAKVLVFPVARSRAGGFDIHVLTRDAADLLQALERAGASLAGETALEAHRIEAGIPNTEHEGGEGVLPQEAGLTYALSYRKGCYLGQEIMARIEARGNLRRRLVGLRLSGRPETSDITREGKTVGRLGGVAKHPRQGTIALASVRTELEPGSTLTIGDVEAEIVALPFSASQDDSVLHQLLTLNQRDEP